MKRILLTLGLAAAVAGAGGYTAAVAGGSTASAVAAQDLPSFRDVVKRVLPAVVSIEAKASAKASTARRPQADASPFENMPGLPDEFRRFFERMPQQPQPQPPRGHAFGSGFVVDPSGVILTNEHVVRNADEVTVKFTDGRTFTSRDIKRDPKTDIAIVRVQAKEPLPALTLADSDKCEVGDRVLAVGAPLGLAGTVTHGIVSAKSRDVQLNTYEDFIQTDAAINPGNSGGPLVNLAGEVIGINSAIKSRTGGFQGIGLAIASNLVKSVKDPLVANGTVSRGYLGVQVAPLEADVAAKLGVTGKGGVVIAKVTPESPASNAGLQDGDVIVEVTGRAVRDPRHLQQLVAGLPVNKPAEIAVVRDGARKVLPVTVEVQPSDFSSEATPSEPQSSEPGRTNLDKLGMTVAELTAEKSKQLGFTDAVEGVLVTDVQADGLAATAGLRAGVVVQKVDANRVKTVAELQKAVDTASLDKGVLLQVKTPQAGTAYVMLKGATSR